MSSRLSPQEARLELANRGLWRALSGLRPRYQAALVLECAARVLPVYEAFYQDNLARKALEAARAWVERPGDTRSAQAAGRGRALRDALELGDWESWLHERTAISRPALVAGAAIFEAVFTALNASLYAPESLEEEMRQCLDLVAWVFGAAAHQEAGYPTDMRAFRAGVTKEREFQRDLALRAAAVQSPRRRGEGEEA